MRDEHSEPGPMTVNFLPSKKSSSQSLISMETRSLEESENGEIKASNEILTELKLQKELYESGLKMINAAIADFETKKVRFMFLKTFSTVFHEKAQVRTEIHSDVDYRAPFF